MTCFFCKGDMRPSTNTYVVDLEKCLVIVRNVPCLRCTQCGEISYTTEVMKELEQIVDVCREVANEITIVNYADKVA